MATTRSYDDRTLAFCISLTFLGCDTSPAADIELEAGCSWLADKKTTKAGFYLRNGDCSDTNTFLAKQRRENVAHTITAKNQTFHDMASLTIKYMIFSKNAKPGSTDKPVK